MKKIFYLFCVLIIIDFSFVLFLFLENNTYSKSISYNLNDRECLQEGTIDSLFVDDELKVHKASNICFYKDIGARSK